MSPRVTACLLALGLLAASPAGALDEALYARLLEKHTRAESDWVGTRVDYPAVAASKKWRQLVTSLADVDLAALRSREQKLAFWINVYNILAIDLVARNWPVASIKDIGSLFSPVWKRPAGRVGGRSVSLDEVEHEIIRPMGDPRAHAAVICASLSCPRLRREPWSAARLDAQLDDEMRVWLANPRKGLASERGAGRLKLSKIFDWFEEDFASAGGVRAFVTRYAPASEQAWLKSQGPDLSIDYFDYDWRVNALAR